VTEGDSAVHYLVEPLHVAPVVLLVLAGLGAGVWLKRHRKALRHVFARRK
jgi:hypothetical protein